MSFTLPEIPNDRTVWHGEIASYWFDDEILISLSNSKQRTVELINNNVNLVKQITGNTPAPLLIYLQNSPVPDKATRQFSTQQLPVIYSAMAMVAPKGLSTLIMTVLFKLKPPPIPIKHFDNETDAKEWLRQLTYTNM